MFGFGANKPAITQADVQELVTLNQNMQPEVVAAHIVSCQATINDPNTSAKDRAETQTFLAIMQQIQKG